VFYEVDKDLVPENKLRRAIFCSGKVYYDLYEERNRRGIKDIALIRVEQLAPFPFDHVERELVRYQNAEIVWCQEEPRNMGAWTFMYFNFKTTFRKIQDKRELNYIGRPPAASPATGSFYQHKREQSKLLNDALS